MDISHLELELATIDAEIERLDTERTALIYKLARARASKQAVARNISSTTSLVVTESHNPVPYKPIGDPLNDDEELFEMVMAEILRVANLKH